MKYKYVGTKVPRVDGPDKSRGKAKYMTDLHFEGALYGKAVHAPHPHCLLKMVDTSVAEKMEGVHGVFTYKDVPGKNLMGLIELKNQPVFAAEKCRFLGDIVALVVAETKEQAEAAAEMVKIDFEPLEVYSSSIEAMKDGAEKIHDDGNILDVADAFFGDVDAAFANADHVIENTYYTYRQHHGYIECIGGYAVPDSSGGLTVYAPVQNPYGDRAQLSSILNLPENKIRCVASPGGGGFGGKDDLFFQPHMAIAALKTGRPILCHADREETILMSVTNQPFVLKMRTAFNKDGKLQAQDVEVICDTGAYSGLGLVITRNAVENCCGCYFVPNVRSKGYTVHTNQNMTGEWKGFGNNQTHFALESQMDQIAEILQMDRIELRLKNVMLPGSRHSLGHELTDAIGTFKTLKHAQESDLWKNRELFKKQTKFPWIKRGVGISVCVHPFTENYSHSSALSVSPTGEYMVHSSVTEHGAGTSTALCMMAAEELGIDIADVSIQSGSTEYSKNSGPITASRANYSLGNTTLACVKKIKARLINCAGELYDIDPGNIVFKNGSLQASNDSLIDMGSVFKKLNEEGRQRVEHTMEIKHPVAPGSNLPDRHKFWSFMTQLVGVEVDTLTGKTDVLIADAYVDAGQVINTLGFEGQVEGGIVMGMGFAIMEELKYERGRLLTDNLQTYLLPTTMDMPEIIVTSVPTLEETGPYGAKGIGEMPAVAIIPAVSNAIYDAVGLRMYNLPATPEEVYMALLDKE